MQLGAANIVALVLAVLIATAVTTALIATDSRERKARGWYVAAILTGVLVLLGALDIFGDPMRNVDFSTVVTGAIVEVLFTKGFIHATRRLKHRWVRWTLTWLVSFLLIFVGLWLGATVASRYFPF
jgi:hypothetical protein